MIGPSDEVTAQELADTGAIQLAERVADLPQPYVSSSRRSCSRCGSDVWISLSAFPLADRLTIVCRPCLEREAERLLGEVRR